MIKIEGITKDTCNVCGGFGYFLSINTGKKDYCTKCDGTRTVEPKEIK